MKNLTFLALFAECQYKHGGRVGHVKPIYLEREYGMNRTTAWRYLKKLIACRLIIKPKRGQYMLNAENDLLSYIGLCVVSPLDVFAETTRIEQNKVMKAGEKVRA